MVKRSTLYLNTRRITSFYCKGGNAKSNNINKQLLMSPDEVDRCNEILKARKSAVSRGQNPKKAEERIRASYPQNKLSEYYEKAQSSKNGKNTAITPKQSKLICKNKTLQACASKITASKPA